MDVLKQINLSLSALQLTGMILILKIAKEFSKLSHTYVKYLAT